MNIKKLAILLFFIGSIIITIGYSASNKSIFINDVNIHVLKEAIVRVMGISLEEKNNASSIYENYDTNKVYLDMSLDNDLSYLKYDMNVKNFGNVLMGIDNITINNDNLVIENINEILPIIIPSLGGSTYVPLTIKKISNDTLFNNVILNVNFKEAYTVTSSGLDIDVPSYILSGNNLIINNVNLTDYLLIVSESGIERDYINDNNVLSINNVEGNINLKFTKAYNMDFAINNDTTVLISPRLDGSNSININEFLQMIFRGNNNSSKVINKIVLNTTYSTSTGKPHKIDVVLETSNNSITQTVTSDKNVTNSTFTVAFDNLNISKDELFNIKNNLNGGTNGNVEFTKQEMLIYFAS